MLSPDSSVRALLILEVTVISHNYRYKPRDKNRTNHQGIPKYYLHQALYLEKYIKKPNIVGAQSPRNIASSLCP